MTAFTLHDDSGGTVAAPAGQGGLLAAPVTHGFSVLAGGLALGVLGDALLRPAPWGPNASAWLLTLLVALALLMRWRGLSATADGRRLLAAAVAFATCLAWRDSSTLRLLNGLAATACLALGLAAVRAWPGQMRVAALTDYALTVCYAAVHGLAGAVPLVFREIGWREVPAGRWYGPGLAVARGALIALPLLFLFGGLFVAADATFEHLVSRAVRWDARTLFGHAWGAAVYAWISAGLLRGVLRETDAGAAPARKAVRPWLGPIEVGTFLGLLNALFTAFVLVQSRYLFGGAATVQASGDLSYAEYARRGFFELVAVSVLVLPVLLLTHSWLRRDWTRNERVYRALAASLIGLLFVIMASAVQRMFLYQRLFGLTELRVYTTAFMAWLGVVFLWFLATVLRGRRRRFGVGALVSGLGCILLLNAGNPDALIVRTNAARVAQGKAQAFDDLYAASLSADAVPALLQALPALPVERQGRLAQRLLDDRSRERERDWRTWNWGRSQAHQAVVEAETVLTATAKQAGYDAPYARRG